jgi:hypothetical protein
VASEDGGSPKRDKDQDEHALLLFDTTHAAMEAEDTIIDRGFWCEVVPRPPDASDTLCGLAIEVARQDLDEIAPLLKPAGMTFEIYQGGADNEK